VAFIGATDVRIYPTNDQILIASTTETEQVSASLVVANPGMDRAFTLTSGTPAPQWVGNDAVLAIAEDRGEAHVYRLAVDGTTQPKAVTTGSSTVTGLSWAAGTLATTRTSATSPAELFVGEEQRTTVAQTLAAQLRNWERFTVPTADGTGDIDAWLMRPAGFDAERRYPVLLNVHGGPFAQYGEYFFDEAQMQAAAGFVVVMGNPRGSSGRDTDWGRAILGPEHPVHPGSGWGSVDVDDVMSILDGTLARFTFCDGDRVGMIGGSYGGYMATWLAGLHGERFRGICSERAVNNLAALETNSDIATRFSLQFGVSHLDDPEFYAMRSPIRLVDRITTPMLLLHSENDERCPISQAEELWVALRLRDVPVDFYRFPGEHHELSRSGSPVHRVQRCEIILDWFAQRLT
jgi:dipeptidyl aminopeptidase/acylaminoacyl peptidase